MGKNLTTLKKGLLLIAVPVIFQLAFIAALFKMQRESVEAQQLAIHTQDVIVQAESVFRTLLETQSNSRGRVITGNQLFADQVRRLKQRAEEEFDHLYALVADSPEQEARVRRIDERGRDLVAWLTRVDELLSEGKRDQAIEEIKHLYGLKRMQALRTEIDQFIDQQRHLDALRRDQLELSWQLQSRLLFAGLFIMILIAVSMLTLFHRSISQRLGILAQKARLLGEGKPLTAPLPGNDEIAQLDRTFHEMAKALAERNQENELFIYSASHDLRAPLVNLRGFSEELTQAVGRLQGLLNQADLPDQLRRDIDKILRKEMGASLRVFETSAERMGTIIDALLQLSRVGRVEYHRQTVDVQAVLHRVVAALESAIASKAALVAIKFLPPVWGDPAAIEQLFANLLSNAVNFLDPERPGRIEVGVLDAAAHGCSPAMRTYYVRDNGLGIPKDFQSKLFLAFQRFHPETSAGEGIGLALARRIVDRHGGEIWAESAPGAGTTFYFTLPAVPVAAIRSGTETARPAALSAHEVPVAANQTG
jgi:signal transduction histidine kinase